VLKKSLIKISYVSLGNILNAGLGFLYIAAVAKTLELNDFGKYALLASFLVIIAKIIDFGTNSIYVAGTISNKEDLNEIFFGVKLFLFLVTIPISYAVLYLFGLMDLKIITIFILGLIGYGFNFTFFAIFQKNENYTKIILINTIPALVKGFVSLLILLKLLTLNFTQAFGIFSISIIACLIFYKDLLIEIKKINIKGSKNLNFIKKSIPAGISLLVNDGWSAISNSVAKITGSFSDVGIFSLADKISNIFSLISLSIFTVLLPKNAARKRDNLKYDFRESIIISLIVFMLAIFTIIFFQVFINVFFEGKFDQSIKILDLLIFSSAITAIYSFMRDYFFIENRTSELLLITIAKLGGFILLVVLTAPHLKLTGIALSNLIASILSLVVTVYLIIFRAIKR